MIIIWLWFHSPTLYLVPSQSDFDDWDDIAVRSSIKKWWRGSKGKWNRMLTLPFCLVQSGPSFSASNASSAPAVNSATPTGKLLDKICNQKLAHILISDVKTKVNGATIRSVSKSRSISLHLCSSHLSFERISSDAKMMMMFQNLLGCFTNTIWSSSKHLHAFLMKSCRGS